MSNFINYVTKDKYGKSRTTERALLAICKVLASKDELSVQKEQGKERTRLKNARKDSDHFKDGELIGTCLTLINRLPA